jgi:hypothetical protein
MTMKPFKSILITTFCLPLLISTVLAQETNAPRTRLEVFEAQTGVVIIKGSGETGSMSAGTGTVVVGCRESTDLGTGRKQSGITVGIKADAQQEDTTVIDSDEVDSLIGGLDSVSKVDWSVTALPTFEAAYTTRGGLRIATYSSRNSPGTIGASLRSYSVIKTRVSLSTQQLAQFRGLIEQAKGQLDALRAKK